MRIYKHLDGEVICNKTVEMFCNYSEALLHVLGKYELDSPDGLINLDIETGKVIVSLSEGKKTHMKFGKYLGKIGIPEKVCAVMSGDLKAAVAELKGVKILLTSTPEEVLEVYRNGPHSCMANCDAVQVYCTDTISVAYVEVFGEIVARSVVCQTEDYKIYVEIYGNKDIMLPALIREGYIKGTLDGESLPVITDSDGNVLMPYLDGEDYVNFTGEGITVGYGDYRCNNTSGLLGHTCDECGEVNLPEGATLIMDVDDMLLCDSCVINITVEVNGTIYRTDSSEIQKIDGEYYHIDDLCYCEYSCEYVLDSEYVSALVDSDGTMDDMSIHLTTIVDDERIYDDFLKEYINMRDEEQEE